MPDVDFGSHFDDFIKEQVARGRFRNASEVVQAALRLLEDRETALSERRATLKREIVEAFEDGRPTVPIDDAFARLRAHHSAQVKVSERGG